MKNVEIRCFRLLMANFESRIQENDCQLVCPQVKQFHFILKANLQCCSNFTDTVLTLMVYRVACIRSVQNTFASLHRFWLDNIPGDVHWNLSDTGWAKSAYSSFFGPWSQGACVFVYHKARFEPVAILDALQKYPISTFCSAPTAYRMMIQEDLSKYKFPSLRHCISAGEPLNPEVGTEWREMTGLEIREGYGQTETVSLVRQEDAINFPYVHK